MEIDKELKTDNRRFTFLCGHDSNISSVLSALEAEDYNLPDAIEKTPIGCKIVFSRWKNSEGEKFYSIDMVYLNNQLLKYYEMKLTSISEIENYENEKSNLMDTAKAVVKNLGLYYEDLTKVIETYIVNWQQMGYNKELLIQIADYCFKSSIRTLDGLDSVVQKLFKLGILSVDALHEYLNDLVALDNKIAKILSALNIKRNVNSYDRTYYKTWTQDWNFDDELLLYATTLSVDKSNAIQYMNKILSNWKNQGVNTIEKAKANSQPQSVIDNKPTQSKYTKEELNALFSNLEYKEV